MANKEKEGFSVKIECPRCGCENYFTGLEEGTKFCSNCNEPLFEKKNTIA